MNRQQFYQYLSSPDTLNADSLPHLTEVMAEYPYFQAARMLLVKNMAILDHIRYNQELKAAAAHIPDRKKLYFLIHPQVKPQSSMPFIEAPLVQTIHAPVSHATPPHKTETSVSASVTDYFDVPDTLETATGEIIRFSLPSSPSQEITEDIVLPSADLLDYELQHLPGYKLELEIPEDFDPEKNRSFSDWLKSLHHEVQKPKPMAQPTKTANRQMDMIESFLKQGDKKMASPITKNTETRDISEPSLRESEDLMTETLAIIHIKQQNYEKAITIFEKLSLKYPEKNIYFASRIQELERLINNQ